MPGARLPRLRGDARGRVVLVDHVPLHVRHGVDGALRADDEGLVHPRRARAVAGEQRPHRPAVELEGGDGAVFGAVLHERVVAPRLRRDADDVAHEVAQQVHLVRADHHHAAAAVALAVEAPPLVAGHGVGEGGPEPAIGAAGPDVAQLARLDDALHVLVVGQVAQHLRDHEGDARVVAGGHDLARFRHGAGHRLFEQHVLARPRRLDGVGRVLVVDGGDVDRVHVVAREQLGGVGVDGARVDARVGGVRLRRLLADVADGDQLDLIAMVGEAVHVGAGDAAASDESDAQGGHGRSWGQGCRARVYAGLLALGCWSLGDGGGGSGQVLLR